MRAVVEFREQAAFDRILIWGRWIVLLAIVFTTLLEHPHDINRAGILWAAGFIALYNTTLQAALRLGAFNPMLRNAALVIDLSIVTLLIYLSEGTLSPFFGIYYLVIVAAGVQYGLSGGIIISTASAILVMGIEIIEQRGREGMIVNIDHVLSTIPYLFLIGFASGILSRQLQREAERRRQVELQARELELQQQAIRREMEVAQDVQAALLPTQLPTLSGLAVAAGSVPAREIGGDLYDFDYTPSGQLTAFIVDVSGKGIPAALALSGLKSNIDAYKKRNLPELLEALNRFMLDFTPEEMFATMAVCRISPRTGKLQVASAGHEPVILVRAATKTTEQLSAEGLPLGVSRDVGYTVSERYLDKGDLVIMYTDGVTDVKCNGQAFGVEELSGLVSANVARGAQGVIDAVFEKLGTDCALVDDATVIVLGMKHVHPA